ncbi:MAG TPA: guanylate kinase [Acetobacteraceae bacterium]|nr:guanylate kinase [Acetobacteraceae bacterium]
MIPIPRRGLCLVLAAPSGAGKSAIAAALVAKDPQLRLSVSVTTRAPRPGEIDGMHYHFRTPAAFDRLVAEHGLLEWARVLSGTHCYGTPRAPVEAALGAGLDMAFDIDWQGHRQLRAALPRDVVGVFILPPDMTTLEARLRARAGDNEAEIARRMRLAAEEIDHWSEFDHVVVNDDLPRAIDTVHAVLRAARTATARQTGLAKFVRGL